MLGLILHPNQWADPAMVGVLAHPTVEQTNSLIRRIQETDEFQSAAAKRQQVLELPILRPIAQNARVTAD